LFEKKFKNIFIKIEKNCLKKFKKKFDGYFWLAHLTVDGKNIPFLTVDC